MVQICSVVTDIEQLSTSRRSQNYNMQKTMDRKDWYASLQVRDNENERPKLQPTITKLMIARKQFSLFHETCLRILVQRLCVPAEFERAWHHICFATLHYR